MRSLKCGHTRCQKSCSPSAIDTSNFIFFCNFFFYNFFYNFFTIFVYNFYLQFLFTIFDYNFCLQFLFTIFVYNFSFLFTIFQITEEEERTSSRNSLEKDITERLKKLKEEDSISIVESEDGVSKIRISAPNPNTENFKQVIEVKEEATRKISTTLEPNLTTEEENTR